MPIENPPRPVLRDVPDVELLKVGQWPASTGPFDATPEVLAAAVHAAQSSTVRRPVIKLGHVDPRFDGEPAVGWVDNLRLGDGGSTLLGDLRGLPAWLADVLPSAYPNRSIEGTYGHVDQTGRRHEFALTGLALLGVSPPAVGTLAELRDVAALYEVAASGGTTDTQEVRIMPRKIAASATVEDVRRSFYEAGPGAESFLWIEELFLDPTEVIAMDDESGELRKIPFTVSDDGAITWGEAETVKREYVAASKATPAATWPTLHLSREGVDAVAEENDGDDVPVDFTESQITDLLLALDLSDDATAADIVAAVEKLAGDDDSESEETADGEVTASSVHAAASAIACSVVDTAALAAERESHAELVEQVRARQVDDAIEAGKILPSRRDTALSQLKSGLLTADDIDALEPVVTMAGREVGHGMEHGKDDKAAEVISLSASADARSMFSAVQP